MSEDYAASVFVTTILGTILVPVLFCVCRNIKSFGKCSLILALVLVFVLLLGFFSGLSGVISSEKPKQPFNPYEILSIPITASESEIKSSFRKLSKIYHPDKNPGENDRYLLITKAYETLTNPTAKENYEKYGNPDGPLGFKVTNI